MKLRRLGAYVDRGQPARLLAGALGGVERVDPGPRSQAYSNDGLCLEPLDLASVRLKD